MSLHLYNSLTRQVEPFAPLDAAAGPTMYLCGPTVYNYIHIGNARGPVVFGVLAALLRRRYGKLRYARNFTDVDDKINAAALEQKVPIATITDRFSAAYLEDLAALGVDGDFSPDLMPAATAHIPQMIAMILRLIEQGHAYAAEGHVLFAVDTFADYGKLSRRDPDEMLAGARVEVAPYKRNPGDFVLWKPSTDELPGWDSPWGRGRPGWHIECSAMAAAHLGETIDIHAGGIDLQFPHHENEVAQSECAHKHDDGSHKTFSRWWMHNGMLNFGGSKMAKSVGNIQRVHDLVREHPPEALRYALLSAHYRQPLEWSDGLIEQTVNRLNRLYETLRALMDVDAKPEIPDVIEQALDEDLNTPKALAELADFNRNASKLTSHAQYVRKTLQALDFNNQRNHELTRFDALGHIQTLLSAGVFPAEYGQYLTSEIQKTDAAIEVFLRRELEQLLQALNESRSIAKKQLLGAGLALGLLQQEPIAWFQRGTPGVVDSLGVSATIVGGELKSIEQYISERDAAKAARDFKKADEIRDFLASQGIVLEDTPQGVRWKRS